jgi:hypothetical protein
LVPLLRKRLQSHIMLASLAVTQQQVVFYVMRAKYAKAGIVNF